MFVSLSLSVFCDIHLSLLGIYNGHGVDTSLHVSDERVEDAVSMMKGSSLPLPILV